MTAGKEFVQSRGERPYFWQRIFLEGLGCATRLRWIGSNALRRVWRDKDSIGLIIRCPVHGNISKSVVGIQRGVPQGKEPRPCLQAGQAPLWLSLILL